MADNSAQAAVVVAKAKDVTDQKVLASLPPEDRKLVESPDAGLPHDFGREGP